MSDAFVVTGVRASSSSTPSTENLPSGGEPSSSSPPYTSCSKILRPLSSRDKRQPRVANAVKARVADEGSARPAIARSLSPRVTETGLIERNTLPHALVPMSM
jgi:hypothetical protein